MREWGEREGGSGKKGRQGEAFSRARLSRVCSTGLYGRREGDVNSPLKFRELLIPLQR